MILKSLDLSQCRTVNPVRYETNAVIPMTSQPTA